MELVEKVRLILEKEFPPPAKIELEDDDGIIGSIVSSRFDGLESIDRINILWDILDRDLSQEERKRVVTIVVVTPLEEACHLAY